MIQRTLHGVVIDQCPESGGIWLDAGELDQILTMSKQAETGVMESFFSSLLSGITGKK